MATEAQNAANQRNSQHSTGPKTDVGKRMSRQNAIKHGLTAKLIEVLPGESQEAYDLRISAFIADQPILTASAMVIIKRIVSADWKLDRLEVAHNATLNEHMRHATIDMSASAKQHAEEIGRRLTYEPLDRMEAAEWREPIVQKRIQQRTNDHPKCLKFELERTTEGVDWMLEQWGAILGGLLFFGYMHYPQKYDAIRLLGHRIEDALDDQQLGTIMVACNMIHPRPLDIWNDFFITRFGAIGKPMFRDQVLYLDKTIKEHFLTSDGIAFEFMRSTVEHEIERLQNLKKVLDPIAAADRAGAEHKARFDASKDGLAMTRYYSTLSREVHVGVNDLMKQTKCDLALREHFEANLDDEPAPVEVPAAAPAVPDVAVSRNEPISEPVRNPGVVATHPFRAVPAALPAAFVDISVGKPVPADGVKGPETAPKPPV